MNLEDLLGKLHSYSIDKKLLLFHKLFKWHKKGRNIRWGNHRTSFKFKLWEAKKFVYNLILQTQEEKPFIDPSISDRIFEMIEKIDYVHNETVFKYKFIAQQFRYLSSENKLPKITIPDVTKLFNSDELDQLFDAVCVDFAVDRLYSPRDRFQKEKQYAIAFAAEFYILHYKYGIEDIILIIQDSLRKEIKGLKLGTETKKIMFYYFFVANLVVDFNTYKKRSTSAEKDISYTDTSDALEASYKKLFRQNLYEIIDNHFGQKVFEDSFDRAWGAVGEKSPAKKKLRNIETAFRVEDLFVMIRDMGIPCMAIFKDNPSVVINKKDIEQRNIIKYREKIKHYTKKKDQK
jgi:hypothetical protein